MQIISKIQNSMFDENFCIWTYNFYITVTHNEATTRKTWPAPEKKKLAFVGKVLSRFNIIFYIYLSSSSWHLFPMLAWVGWFLMKDFQVFLSLAMSLLTFLSFRSLLITSFYVFLGRPLGKLLLTSKVLHLLDEALSSILSRCPNYCSRLSSCSSILVQS